MKSLLMVASLLLFGGVSAQEPKHAPTVEACRADVALWFSRERGSEYIKAETAHLRFGTPNTTEFQALSLREVDARGYEMGECVDVDREHLETYYDAQEFYSEIASHRMSSFITRHHLWQQVYSEDDQGLR